MRGFGIICMLAGFGVAAYALFIFDASVSTAIGRLNNIGLLQDRQNLLIASCAVSIVGAILIAIGSRSSSPTSRE
jgi:hypothetical protein